ncbi:TetR/AcrR family transcriptional regulator [Leptospira semungkisensis]|uniref:TetR/AcrR family transcriptional regulator n=1 Tax=Leptospira semungkisensis TaxID=2484985 RepID=A0A4R9G8V4_9LEPT|nr:TetR/AcrR family transcriptional regulator [Leptospira semungkisensis]TGK07480.1 TetR/AcrR family transcriptional regulator [Leptospira semungkisensis]
MSTGRPIEYDREHSLQKALELFWRNGYKGTNLKDLCDETGLSKSSLYSVFGDKHQVFLLSIQSYSDALLDELRLQYQSSESPLRFIEKVLLDLADEASPGKDRKGCLVMNSATEFAQTDPQVAKIVGNTLRKMASIFENAVSSGKESSDINKNVEPHSTALFLVNSIAGMKTMVKAGHPKKELLEIAKSVMKHL